MRQAVQLLESSGSSANRALRRARHEVRFESGDQSVIRVFLGDDAGLEAGAPRHLRGFFSETGNHGPHGRETRRDPRANGARAVEQHRIDAALDFRRGRRVRTLGQGVVDHQLAHAGTPGPRAIGIDELSIRKGHSYRIVVSDLDRRRAIWFGGEDRSEASMAQFYDWLGPRKSGKVELAVMDMWKPFRTVANQRAPQAAILFDKFHIMRHLGEALDKVRKAEYARVSGKDRRFIKGQKYNLLSRHDNLKLEGKRSLALLLAANKRLNTAYLLKEGFGQLWNYRREGWARCFFDNWRNSLKWQRLKPYERFADMIDRHWNGIAAYCKPENKVSLGFVEGLNNKIRVFQRRAYGLRDEEYLRLKVLTCMLDPL